MFSNLIIAIEAELETSDSVFKNIKEKLLELNFLSPKSAYTETFSKLQSFIVSHETTLKKNDKLKNNLDTISNIISILFYNEYDQLLKIVGKDQTHSNLPSFLRDELLSYLMYKFFMCPNEEKLQILTRFKNVENSQDVNLVALISDNKTLFRAFLNRLSFVVSQPYGVENSHKKLWTLLSLSKLVQEEFNFVQEQCNIDVKKIVDGFQQLFDLCIEKDQEINISPRTNKLPFVQQNYFSKHSIDTLELNPLVEAIIHEGQAPLEKLIENKSFLNIVHLLNPIYERCNHDQVKYVITNFAVNCLEKEIQQCYSSNTKGFLDLHSLFNQQKIWDERHDEMERFYFPYEAAIFS